jgi:hypothetical protein
MRRALASGCILAWIAVTGSACATRVRVDFDHTEDFARYRTWDWNRSGEWFATTATGVDRGLDALVRDAVARGLEKRGFSRTKVGRPDFLVAYHVSLERVLVRRLETPATQTVSSHHRDGSFEVTASTVTHELYETGTFVLLVADAGNLQKVWRATAVRRVRESFRPQAEGVVSAVLDRFPAAADLWF